MVYPSRSHHTALEIGPVADIEQAYNRAIIVLWKFPLTIAATTVFACEGL
jgi:hypothetical protein